uniref:Interleukin 17c n=1 Tax=Periophthalmus magnuspinnatus TaxID=409849 RepID=A0A3B4A9T3_9GOBI
MTSRACVIQAFVLGACTAMVAARCLSAGQLKVRADRFQARHQVHALNYTQQRELTCAQLVEQAQQQPQHLYTRALSPWTYRLNRDERRFPRDISEARCLCSGCILHRAHEDRPHEEHGYNSVPVYTHMLVLSKTPCAGQPNKYRLTKRMLRVPVACTCVVPKYIDEQRKTDLV